MSGDWRLKAGMCGTLFRVSSFQVTRYNTSSGTVNTYTISQNVTVSQIIVIKFFLPNVLPLIFYLSLGFFRMNLAWKPVDLLQARFELFII